MPNLLMVRPSPPEVIQKIIPIFVSVDAWMKSKDFKTFGMPRYIGSGSHETKKDKYRFLVMERFGKDLWSVFQESNRQFPVPTISRIGCQILDVLEYIHSRGYVHADIKGANLLLEHDTKIHNQIYVVDFGLAGHFTTKEYKPDPKKAHNGTIEYTSRDAHDGVLTRRSDIEILAYNLFQWLGNTLPWEKDLSNPVNVQSEKIKFFKNLNKLKDYPNMPGKVLDNKVFLFTCLTYILICFLESFVKFFKYIDTMKHDTEPDYQKIRSFLLENVKAKAKEPFKFTSSPVKPKVQRKRKSKSADDDLTPLKPEIKRKQKSKSVEDESNESSGSLIYPSPDVLMTPRRIQLRPVPGKTIISKSETKTLKKAKSVQNVESDESNDEPEEKRRVAKRTTKKAIVEEEESEEDAINDLSDESDIENDVGTPNTGSKFHPKNIKEKTPTPKRKVLRNMSEASTSPVDKSGEDSPKKVKVTKKVVKKAKPSWRDCPTIRNGKIAN